MRDTTAQDAACSARRTIAAGRPCARCPWVLDTPPGEFDAERYDSLRRTTGEPGAEAGFDAPMFACHKTSQGREVACAGWLRVAGVEHLGVRLAVAQGLIPAEALGPLPADWPALHPDYATMAAAQTRPDPKDEPVALFDLDNDLTTLTLALGAARVLDTDDDPGEYRDAAVSQLARSMGEFVRILKALNGPGCDRMLFLLHTEGNMPVADLVRLTGIDAVSMRTRLDRRTGDLLGDVVDQLVYIDADDAAGLTLRVLHPDALTDRVRDALATGNTELRRILTEYAPGKRRPGTLRIVLADAELTALRPQILTDLARQLVQAHRAARQREVDAVAIATD